MKLIKKLLPVVFGIAAFAVVPMSKAAFPVKNESAKNEVSLSVSQTDASIALSKAEVIKSSKSTPVKAKNSNSAGSGKSQLVALLLCAFVGGIGIHRFYLGYIGIGIIQLLTLGGCGIWALIDLVRIAIGDLGPADGDYDTKI